MAKTLIQILTVGAIGATLVVGCKSASSPIVGKWTTLTGLWVEFKADRTFTMGSPSQAGLDAEGSWQFGAGKAMVRTSKRGGQPVPLSMAQRAIEFDLSQDGSKLTEQTGAAPVDFTRDSQ